jgi:L-fuculose-phosphate aldolase
MWQLKKEMSEIGHRIWLKGFCAGNEGNHSVRISEDRVLCTPTGISKGFLDPDDMCIVDMDGKQVEVNPRGRKRTSEVLVHLAIYKKRPDIGAVIHSHPPHATAFAIAGVPVPMGMHPEAEVFLGKIPIAPYALPSTQALPDSITPLIGPDTNTVLMGNHGTVSFSKTLIDTYYKLEIVDAYCRILLLLRDLNTKPNVLNPQQMQDLLKVKAKFGFHDDRLECAIDGCVEEENQPFFATFEKTDHAACSCNGAPVSHGSNATGNSAATDAEFEKTVKLITDQIMASMKK